MAKDDHKSTTSARTTGARAASKSKSGQLPDNLGANRMWGGRFAAGPAAIMEEINASIGFDKVLAPQDIRGSKAHAEMLAAQGIVSADDLAAIRIGMTQISSAADRLTGKDDAGSLSLPFAVVAIAAAVAPKLVDFSMVTSSLCTRFDVRSLTKL